MPMSPQAEQIWNWVECQFDDPSQWCKALGGNRGPSYGNGEKVPIEVYDELNCMRGEQYSYDGKIHKTRVLPPQRKGDGRSAQGNIQLFCGQVLCVNLHVPLNINPPPKIEKATDGGGDWTVPQARVRVPGKKKNF